MMAAIGFSAVAQSQSKTKVAVYVTGDVDNSVKKILGAKLVTAITSSGEFAAVERTADFLAALSKENDYQVSGEVRDSQIARLGQKFGVKFVVVADINEAFDELFVASRLINVESGLVERAYDANGAAESMQQLIDLSREVISGLLNSSSVSAENTLDLINRTKGTGKLYGHEYVDLGLPSGLKWATCNVGASTPGGLGTDHSANGYDAAREQWGGSWRLPTKAECEELLWNCDWQWIKDFGYKVTGPNGKYIYLPATRYRRLGIAGDYLTSTPSDHMYYYTLYFTEDDHHMNSYWNNGPSRPVTY